ncbi:alpha-ketoglutarate-dependent dioxygenase AlkB, partial [Streptomyces venezuelae]
MTTHHLQGSLFDQTDDVRLGSLAGIRRTVLGDGAWI